MEFITKKIEGIIIIELSGNIMGGPESTKINQELHTYIEKGESKFIIDLKNVTVMNSSGLGTLIASLSSIKKSNGQLKVSAANSKIKNLFVVTRLDTIFEICDDTETAIKSYQK